MISFIILHYKNIIDTCECIESIKNLKDKNISIVVVDNNTLNKDDEKKLNKYKVDLIKLDSNMGYAKANNVGCKHAIEKYKPDFLCVINNDTVIKDKDFCKKIRDDYKEYEFDLLGPRIDTNNGDSVNPFPVYKTLEEVENKIEYNYKLIKIYKSRFLSFLLSIYLKLHKSKKEKPVNGEKLEKGIALHGCAIVFSKKYYKRYKDVFYNETFLYHEEEFLYQRIMRDNLLSIYDPNFNIYHKEGASLNTRFDGDRRKKLVFRHEEIVKSLMLLKKVIIEGEEDE